MIKRYLLTAGLAAVLACQSYAQDGPEMVDIQGGTFKMGNNYASSTSDEGPQHKVELNSFRMSKTEVTFELFDLFCDATGHIKPSDGKYGRGKRPVTNVSWEAAVKFCNWLSDRENIDVYYKIMSDSSSFKVEINPGSKGYRLPTEAEWEYAARGGQGGKVYSYSGSNDFKEVAWIRDNSGNTPREVGLKKPNDLGLYDMSGNVWEWCWDIYDRGYYSQSPEKNPLGPDKGTDRVYRGGSWKSGQDELRLTVRQHNTQNNPTGSVGIRLAQSL